MGPIGKYGPNLEARFEPDFAALLGDRGQFDPASPRAIVRTAPWTRSVAREGDNP